jgi:antitoxin component of RelBE/YafQ-DinJ toxin-antitoxin module
VTPEAYYAEVRRMGLTPSNVPTVYIDRNGQTQGVPLPYGMTPDQREETITMIRDMQQLNQT